MSVLQEKLRRLLIKSIDTFSLDPPFSLYISSLPLVGHETQKSISNISNVAKVFLQSYLFQVFTLTKVFVLWYDVTIEERSNLFFSSFTILVIIEHFQRLDKVLYLRYVVNILNLILLEL